MEEKPESQYVLEKELTEEEISAQKKAELENIKEHTRTPKWLQLVYGGVATCAILFGGFYAYKVYHYKSPDPLGDILHFRYTISGNSISLDKEYTTVDSRIVVKMNENDISVKANSNLKYVRAYVNVMDNEGNSLEVDEEISVDALSRGKTYTLDPYSLLSEEVQAKATSYSISRIQYKY